MTWLGIASGLLAVAAAVVWWLRTRLLVVTVHGSSMLPAYRNGDRLLVRRRAFGPLRAGQVVVAYAPEPVSPEPTPVGPAGPAGDRPVALAPGRTPPPDLFALGHGRQRVVKRIAAVPGDPILAGIPHPSTGQAQALDRVPPAKVVLLGDNPAASVDSRHYGWVDTGRIIGVVLRPIRNPAVRNPVRNPDKGSP